MRALPLRSRRAIAWWKEGTGVDVRRHEEYLTLGLCDFLEEKDPYDWSGLLSAEMTKRTAAHPAADKGQAILWFSQSSNHNSDRLLRQHPKTPFAGALTLSWV